MFYFDTNSTYDNSYEFWTAGNQTLSISQYNTEIKNPLIVYEDATFSSSLISNS